MVMVPGCAAMADVHDRMPVLLRREDWQVWDEGTSDKAFALCRTWEDGLSVDRTEVLWSVRGKVTMS